MKKLAILIAVVLLAVLATPAGVLADLTSDAITVSVAGNGTWSDGVLSLSLFPGESKCFEVMVHNNWDSELFLEAQATPNCVSGSDVTACFCPSEATLGVNATCMFNLTIAASGSAPPSELELGGVFSTNLTISASAEAAGNETEPEPEAGVPHHVTLSLSNAECVVGDSHEVLAIVYDGGDVPLANVSVGWSMLSGSATFTSVDVVTDSNGRAGAIADCSSSGTSVARCNVSSDTSVLETINLVWIADSGDDGNGDDNTAPDIRQPIGSISFGEVLVDDTLDKAIAVYNDGDAPLVISSVVWSSGSEVFTYVGPLAPFTVGSESSTMITVRFTPTSTGDLSATFIVTSNDSDTAGLSFTVSGTGKSRGQPAWKVFLIGILIIGGCFGGYIYYGRWKAKREGLDILARGGGEDIGLGGDDELNLDT